MSLDVSLTLKDASKPRGSGIFVREDGQTREIQRDEWDRLHPDQEPVVVMDDYDVNDEVFDANITHNLNRMADEAGIYQALWRPEEIGITKAAQLIAPLFAGLELLRADPPRFEKLNPENGWGDYRGFVVFVEKYLDACREYPEAIVRASR